VRIVRRRRRPAVGGRRDRLVERVVQVAEVAVRAVVDLVVEPREPDLPI